MNFKEYLKQLSIVILGILIAYWISNIGTHLKETATQKQVLLTILNEQQDNNKSLKTTLQSLDSLRTIFTGIQNKSLESGMVAIKYSGLSLNSIGYETAKYTGVFKDLDYKLASKIVENYESQDALIKLEKMMSDELFELLRTKISNSDNVDYFLMQVTNLINNINNFETGQKQLTEDLAAYLKADD